MTLMISLMQAISKSFYFKMTILIFSKKIDQKSIADTMNKEVPKVTEWFNSNKLRINTKKTVAMLLHTRQMTLTINESLIKMNVEAIPFSTHEISRCQH